MSLEIKIYSYPLCNTCRKAIKWLKDNSLNYELLDITKSPPGKDLLIEALNQQGNIKALFNTSGASYRNIGASRIKAMDNNQLIDCLNKDPKLIKRPFLISSKGTILIGFKVDIWEKILLTK